MKNLYIVFFELAILLLHFPGQSQNIQWNTTPQKGFVFQISNKEAQKLLTISSLDTIFNGLLHTLIDTFDVSKGWTNRPDKGHFILANIVENKLHCEYTSVFPYQVFLLKEYDALSLQVLDLDGNVREDAKVKFKLKRLRIDAESKTYRIKNEWFYGDNKIVTVELDGFRSVFNIQKHDVPEWYNNFDSNDDGPSYYSYLITDKNKYKPAEKVRFKSYALSQSRSPLHRELEVWLLASNRSIKVGNVEPHRPGSYAGEFQLHDSLKLTLDRYYNLQLRERNGRVVSACNFKFEDYELNGNQLEIQLATAKQYYPAKNELSIIATDVNGLMLKDARASVVVRSLNIRETFQPLAILKDTLLFIETDLNHNEATVIDIPSRLFQQTNTGYDVHVMVRNSQNQLIERTALADHFYSQYELVSRFSNDSIIYEALSNGMPLNNVPMRLIHNGEEMAKSIVLPYKEKLNPVVSTVYLRGELVSREISMNSLLPEIDFEGGILEDSFKIQLHNPQVLETSWYIYQGSELLQKGFGKEMEYNSMISDRSQTYYVELLYSFGGQDRIKRKEYEFNDGSLNVMLDIPDKVFPGQEVDASITVTNQQGRPVSGVDLTALGVTGKLNYYLPDLPYYGRSSAPRPMKATYSKNDVNKRTATLRLDYKKWAQRVRLDTMTYYQFTYPRSKLFVQTVSIDDSTQFAPYVMRNGMAEQIYVIEIDRRPVFFSWVDEPHQYSFYVPTGRKSEVSLRLYDRVLILDSLSFAEGKKTILSMDIDHLPPGVRVHKIDLPKPKNKYDKVYPSFTHVELNRYTTFLSSFKRVVGNAYLETTRKFTPLFSSQLYSPKESIIVGPLVPGTQTFIGAHDNIHTTYQHTGGYNYGFEDNIVYKLNADKLIPERLFPAPYQPMTTVNDYVMTKRNFLETVAPDYRWHTRLIDLVDYSTRVKVLLPDEKAASGFLSFLFENSVTREIISPCQNRFGTSSEYFTIPRGLYNAIVIYNNGTYLKMDSINLISFSKVVVDLGYSSLHAPDSLSRKWQAATYNNCYRTTVPRVIRLRHSDIVYGNIKGTVYAEDNLPLPGANIVIKGTINGATTDIDGKFALDADEPLVTLVVSFVGYATKEIEVQIGSEVSLFMEPDIQQLQEIVVVGYGVQTSQSLTFALSGRVAGVQISTPDIVEKTEVPDQVDKKEAAQRLYQELLTIKSIRSNFSDVGFWEPKLYTDRDGQSKFKIKYPDDITRWEATVYAMNRRLQTGTARKRIQSYKPIMAELHTPQFLTRGDSSFCLGKVLNYSDDKSIAGKAKWDSGQTDFEKDIHFTDFHIDKLPVNATSTDSLTLRYMFTRDDGYLDGEERKVPVVEQGLVRAGGTLSILKDKEDVHVRASSNENITIEILANQLDLYAGEARALLAYKYDCNEQLASKLLGLINYRLLMSYESRRFRYDKDVNKIIARLLKNQNEEFLWSWWDVSPNTSYWMSAHILRALKVAKDAGYDVALDVENIRRKAEYKFDILHQQTSSDIDLVHALALWNAQLDYPKHLRKLDTLLLERENDIKKKNARYYYHFSLLKEKLLLLEAKQLVYMPYERDSLLKYKKEDILGDIHFSDGKSSRYWYSNELTTNAIAYRIVKGDSLLKDLLVPMQMYFLSQRNRGEWNTYHSSNIVTSVLPDLLAAGATKKQGVSINLSGKVNATINELPYQLELLPEEEVVIRKESGLPVYFMQYKKERITYAKTGVEGFEINTRWSNNQSLLEAGKPATLVVEVNLTKEADLEYVMIEVPIPGACSYSDKMQNSNHFETHREYFKDRTVIFCENMKSGKYVFNIHLLPRFTGIYLVNPAQVSLMYVPVVNANTDMKSVRVD